MIALIAYHSKFYVILQRIRQTLYLAILGLGKDVGIENNTMRLYVFQYASVCNVKKVFI